MSFKDLGKAGGRELSAYQTEATKAIEAAVFKLASNVAQLKKLVDVLGTAKDTVEHRHRIGEANVAIQQLAKSIKEQITALHDSAAAAGGTAGGAPDGSAGQMEMIKAKRLLQDFANILQDYKATQKVAADREAATLPKRPPPGAQQGGKKGRAGAGGPEAAPLLDMEEGGASFWQDGAMEAAARMQAQRQAEAARLDDAIVFHDALIEERDHGIAEIQRQIGEVNEMFQDLAVLINDQGVQVQTIDEQITVTAERVKEGQRELVKAERSGKAVRNKCLWMWLVAAIVLAVLLIIMLA